ncbi:hypothetical protein P3X46_022417 [Hevea brasiliensis]|uniref:Aldose 1-epimerase n=1 Tax=Hevea brasiliensis TaxID=3981 RepID=A0ABQ9L9L6_HEVBR|nr:hypothetical protein P3X46_022417 [Hevea brasiliensis]
MADQTQNPQIFELNNGTMLVKITNFGCIITSMPVPDKNGNLADVVLGFDSVEPYLSFFNKPPNSLHGGHNYVIWEVAEYNKGENTHQSPSSTRGNDHKYVLNCGEEKSGLKHSAKLKDPSSLKFYTGNYVNGVVYKGGTVYGKHSGLRLERQGFPNARKQSNFASVVIQPGEKYKHTMLFEFSVE